MTALLLLAALFGGLCWAGRSRRIYRERYIDNDVDAIYDDQLFVRQLRQLRHKLGGSR